MKKAVLFFLIFQGIASAYSYNALLLQAQASIFPKILLLDKKLDEKLINGKIVFTVVYEENDRFSASEVRELIASHYGKELEKYPLEIKMVEYSDASAALQSTAVYLLNSERNMKGLASAAMAKGIISFVYDYADLQKGFLFSLVIEKSTIICLNKEVLQHTDVDFVDALYQIVRFTNEK
jgi:hypothetical protein